jgi:tetratricopeptide (TPR) repeat protein
MLQTSCRRKAPITPQTPQQSELAQAIAGALKTALTPAEQTRTQVVPTHNLEAWEAYQLGKQRMIDRNSANLADAERFFREAIDFDPRFALAHVGLADVLALQANYSGLPWEPTLRDAEAAVAEALKLDPNLAEAWASAGGIAADRLQYDRAETMFRRAIELNPNYAPARHWYGLLLTNLGRQADALPQLQRAAELDALSSIVQEALGVTLENQGDFSGAEAQYRKAHKVDPSRAGPYARLALLNAYALQRTAEAVPLIERGMTLDAGSPTPPTTLAGLYLDLGEDTKLAPLSTLMAKRWPDEQAVQFALALAALVRADSVGAVRHAQRALDGYPHFPGPLAILRNADLQSGRYDAAHARYELAFPELFIKNAPRVDWGNCGVAIDVALVEQKRGDTARAGVLLEGAERVCVVGTLPRLSVGGYGSMDVQIHALRGQKNEALKALRVAEKAGWRGPYWRFYRDDPALDSIRDDPEFKAVFADIERDMARQRAALAARPKDARLDLAPTGT